MLKYVVLWIVLGIVTEIGAGMYVGYYEDKCGITDPDDIDVFEKAIEYLEKELNNTIFYKFINILPSGLTFSFGLISSILFWPIHAPWIVNTCVHVCDDYIKTRMTNEP